MLNAGGGGYWLGMEDQVFSTSDKDCNDMVVRVTPFPEPGSMLLLASGLVGLAGYARRKRQTEDGATAD